MKDVLIKKILELEWNMFSAVQNKGGKASCQNDRQTFELMRSSQFETYPIEVLQSYHEDLKSAEAAGRNLMTEKYARMMESTSPDEYAGFKDLLPALDNESISYINKIIQIHMAWENTFREKYPFLASLGRPSASDNDSAFSTSIQTYMRGELSTYSKATLKHYCEYVEEMADQNVNLAELTILNTAKKYGYTSLKEANDKMTQKMN